ncbi:MAG: cell division protein ZapA [Blastocatellia bacterium]|jgi:cell division protein ZapA
MDNIGQIVSVRIHNQSYNIRANDGNVARTMRLAALVDTRMNAIAEESSTADSLKVAILAALHLADELDRVQQQLEAALREVGHKSDACVDLLDRAFEEKKP